MMATSEMAGAQEGEIAKTDTAGRVRVPRAMTRRQCERFGDLAIAFGEGRVREQTHH